MKMKTRMFLFLLVFPSIVLGQNVRSNNGTRQSTQSGQKAKAALRVSNSNYNSSGNVNKTSTEWYNEGVKYYNLKNYKEAFKCTYKAAEQGLKNAQHNLGVMYSNGQGVNQDFAEAAKWYRKAAEQGYADAQNNLGFLYTEGLGVNQDYVEAMRWYHKAAEQGNALAQRALGLAYARETVKSNDEDYTEALRWLRAAAQQGDAESQRLLGGFYHVGAGVGKDLNMARYWCQKALENGDDSVKEKAREMLEKIEDELNGTR